MKILIIIASLLMAQVAFAQTICDGGVCYDDLINRSIKFKVVNPDKCTNGIHEWDCYPIPKKQPKLTAEEICSQIESDIATEESWYRIITGILTKDRLRSKIDALKEVLNKYCM